MFDKGRHHRAKIGFVLLATEQTIEDDMFLLRPDGVGVHFARAWIGDSITVDSLSRHAGDLARAASTLLPDGSLDVICYGCTSGSLVIGEDRVAAELNKGAPRAKATSLITAVLEALRAVGAKRVAVATPYLDEINDQEVQYLKRAGFQVTQIQGLQLEKDSDMIRVSPKYLAEFAKEADTPDSDALFISCGALRSLEIAGQLEQELGKPVICSNQAMMWHVLRLAGIQDRISGYGQLLRDH
ncbi:maleate cis-trans isomerase family protein [Leisingera sp. McT4-56]|uniref:maleate cis-trans isomerase family protein n=1 Tax=Leisingera sp. McT4-56 TaxID=2881255 RepID=UPI001CF8F42F|nr:arylmalonate decarboxylase [Leisingera sp. McT4-56]MCB4457336.1 arylmalonate decarboxylase [Leisingera sp. McT4-56]